MKKLFCVLLLTFINTNLYAKDYGTYSCVFKTYLKLSSDAVTDVMPSLKGLDTFKIHATHEKITFSSNGPLRNWSLTESFARWQSDPSPLFVRGEHLFTHRFSYYDENTNFTFSDGNFFYFWNQWEMSFAGSGECHDLLIE